jgi:hypothetical protein
MVNRVLGMLAAVPFAAALAGAAPDPFQPDRAWALAATWSCRTLENATMHEVGVRHGDEIVVTNEITTVTGQHDTVSDRFLYDAAANTWHITTGQGLGRKSALTAVADPWTGAVWDIRGREPNGDVERVRYELFANGEIRRSVARPAKNGAWSTFAAERCRVGDDPPPEGTCIYSSTPAQTLSLPRTSLATMPFGAGGGTVTVAVDLDEQSRIVGTKILKSTNPALNSVALDIVRSGTYRTATVNCTPVKGRYVFVVDF